MDNKSIANNERRYKHLDDIAVAQIVTTMDLTPKSERKYAIMSLTTRFNCSRDTIYRIYRMARVELKNRKNGQTAIEHQPQAAVNRRPDRRLRSRSNSSKLDGSRKFLRDVVEFIKGGKLRTIDEAVHVLGERDDGLCTKTVYTMVHRGLVPGLIIADLPRAPGWKASTKWKKYTSKKYRGTPIEERPKEIAERMELGHWEADLVVGPKDGVNGAYLTIIERKTRLYIMIPIPNKKSETVLKAFQDYRDRHPLLWSATFKTITFDNGV